MANQIIYSTTRVPNADGRTVKNPQHFTKPIDGATKVYLNGAWPKVRGAYERAGVSVSDIEDMRAVPKPKKEAAPEPDKTDAE